MNPFSQALLDYHAGDHAAEFAIVRDDGFSQAVPAAVFFGDDAFPPLERAALGACRGSVLDVGAAAGRHALFLARAGLEATALEILPELGALLRDRGVPRVIVADVFDYAGGPFDTLLLLMNGVGMAGTPERSERLLHRARGLVRPGGQVLGDSIDVSRTPDPVHAAYREANVRAGRPPGMQRYSIRYRGEAGEPFDWLHLDFPTLAGLASRAGWRAELLASEPDGRYLFRLC